MPGVGDAIHARRVVAAYAMHLRAYPELAFTGALGLPVVA